MRAARRARGAGRERRCAAEWSGARAAGAGTRRARRDGLLALHLGDHRRAQGGRARPSDAPGRSPLWRRRARRGPRRPGLRDLEALLPLCARQCALDPAPRAGQCLSPSGLAGCGLGGGGDAELSPHALLLRPDLLRRAAPGRAAARIPSPPPARASPRASGCPRRSTRRGGPASASRSSTAWARPRPCSWCSRTGRARAARGRRGCPCRARRRSCATPPVERSPTASRACSGSGLRRWRSATTSASTSRGGRSSANGSAPATCIRRDGDGFYVHCGREDDRLQGRRPVGDAAASSRRWRGGIPTCWTRARSGRRTRAGSSSRSSSSCRGIPAPRRPTSRRACAGSSRRACRSHQWPRGILVVRRSAAHGTGKLQRFRLRELVVQIGSTSRRPSP